MDNILWNLERALEHITSVTELISDRNKSIKYNNILLLMIMRYCNGVVLGLKEAIRRIKRSEGDLKRRIKRSKNETKDTIQDEA